MTDQELSQLIAKFLEPSAGLPQFISARNDVNAQVYLNRKCWKAALVGYDGEGRNQYVPEPRDMVNNPEMTVMLMEKLIRRGATICAAGSMEIGEDWADIVIDYGATSLDSIQMPLEQTGRAIAEAFAKANGLVKEG